MGQHSSGVTFLCISFAFFFFNVVSCLFGSDFFYSIFHKRFAKLLKILRGSIVQLRQTLLLDDLSSHGGLPLTR